MLTIGLGVSSPGVARAEQDPAIGTLERCHALTLARHFQESIPTCLAAANVYRQIAAKAGSKVHWDDVYFQGDAFAYVAASLAALGQHQSALGYARSAHQQIAYVYGHFELSATERGTIVALATRLQQIEAVETAAIAR